MLRGYGVALAGVAVAVGLGVAAAVGPMTWAQGGGYSKTAIPLEEARATLEAMGYEVLSLGLDDDEYEGYAMRDGRRWEVELNAATGRLTEAEFEADDDDDHELDDGHRDGGELGERDRDASGHAGSVAE